MKKRLLFLWTFLLCIVGGMSATEMTNVITFKDTGTSSDNSTKRTTIEDIVASGAEYISAITETTNVYNGRTGRGLKLGAGGKAATLKMTLANPVKPIKVTFTAMWYKSGEQSITVNGKDFTELTGEMTEYTVEYDGNTEVSEIAISTPVARAYIGNVTIYYDGETPAVAAPVITGTTPFFGTTTVTLNCETEGASIYYTVDGVTEPTAESTPYAEPFTIDATTTVKAIAINGEDASAVASKTFEAIPAVADIATLNALTKGDLFGFTGDAVIVANPNNKHVYIKDATGSSLIYDSSAKIELAVGSHITPNWLGKVDVYNGLFEAVPTSELTVVEGTPDVITYDEATLADLTAENVNKVVVLKGVTYTAPADGSKNFSITQGETTITTGYNQFGITIEAPAEGKTYDIVGAIGRYGDAIQFQPITIIKVAEIIPVTINAETGADLTTLVNAEKEKVVADGDKVGDITINLAAGGAYTVSGTLEAPASIVVNGNKAIIDASSLSGSFIMMSKTPSVELINNFYRVANVKIADVTIKGAKGSLFYDNGIAYCVVDFTVDNVVSELVSDATVVSNEAIISFKSGGVKDLSVKNSTIYGNASTKYFVRYGSNGRIDRYGYTESTDTWSMTYTNNTFYNVIKSGTDGQWGNYSGVASKAGQMILTINDNIWMDCSSQVMRRLTQSKTFSSFNSASTMQNNTFWNTTTDTVDTQDNYGNSTDLVTNPTFVDAANGDFTIGASTQQAKEKTGDPRWLVEYVAEDITEAKAALKAEIETATALLGDADTETDEAAKALKDAIDKAQGVYDTAEFNEILKAATEELKAAEEAYKKATSGISNIGADANADNGAWYNLQGVRMEKPTQKGIYIHNGKKIVVK